MSQRALIPLPVLVIASADGSALSGTSLFFFNLLPSVQGVPMSDFWQEADSKHRANKCPAFRKFFFFFREFITAIFTPSTIEINDQQLQNNNYKVLHHPRGVQLLESSRPKTFFQPSVTLWLYGFGFMARCYSYNLKFCVQVYEDKSRRLRLPLEAPNSHNSL